MWPHSLRHAFCDNEGLMAIHKERSTTSSGLFAASRWRRVRLQITLVGAIGFLALGTLPVSAQFSSSSRRLSEWWPKVDLVDGSLHNGTWTYARKSAAKLADQILKEAWNDPELKAVLAELALYQAIAEANLDRREDAIWHWHTALNLEPRIARRDFSDYGNAARLFVEFPLRKRGEMPPGFQDSVVDPSRPPTTPIPPAMAIPTLLNNNGSLRQPSGDFEVEIIVDTAGELHQPVVISNHLHPIVIYACLDWLHGMGAFTPGEIDRQPVSALFPLIVGFQISPYGDHLTIRPEIGPN